MGKTARRFSHASNLVTSYIQDLVSKDVEHNAENGLPYLRTLSEYSLTVPQNRPHSVDIEEDPFLTDRRMKITLEEAGLINWCPGIKRLIPLAVTNDGNTLCHSASMALWGVQDKQLSLRHLIGKALNSHSQQEFRERWEKEVSLHRVRVSHGNYHQDVEVEWQVLTELPSTMNKSIRSSSAIFEPLEEFHIFVLANILRRPILIFAERPIRSVEPPDFSSCFAALYLPLLWKSAECCRSPLVLGYCDNYFAPLITLEHIPKDVNSVDSSPTVVPLVGIDKIPIEHRYLTYQEEQLKDQLLKEYLFTAEIESTNANKVTHIVTVAKLIPNPLNESQKLILEYLNTREQPEPKQAEDMSNTQMEPNRRLSKFRCGNKTCSRFIDQDHLFPYCSECHPKFQTSLPTGISTRRKMNSANTVVPPSSLEIECATLGCPYYASVSSFPYCQRCKNNESADENQTLPPKSSATEMTLEDRWQKLAMGVVDEQIISGVTNANIKSPEDEGIFARLCTRVEDGEKCGFGNAASTQCTPVDKKHSSSATGARSVPPRKAPQEEVLLATNAIDINSPDDWKRKVSWINEPCVRTNCPYFASARTYPYCNQCASDLQTAPTTTHRNRKVSGTCTLSTLVQED